jgi:arylsulfatase A-like enzyme
MSPAAWTLPSVTSILTGMVPSRHGSRHGGELVPPGIELLAERFRARGITTFAVSTNPLIDGILRPTSDFTSPSGSNKTERIAGLRTCTSPTPTTPTKPRNDTSRRRAITVPSRIPQP